MSGPEIPEDAVSRLRHLAAFIPEIEQPDFDLGRWAGGDRKVDGSYSMPYYEFSERGLALIATLPVIHGLEWPAWMKTPRAQELVGDHRRIADASLEELVRLSTAIIRSNRFSEGSIAGAFESGLILAVARRARALVDGDRLPSGN